MSDFIYTSRLVYCAQLRELRFIDLHVCVQKCTGNCVASLVFIVSVYIALFVSDMRSKWRLPLSFIRNALRVHPSRSSVCRKFTLAGLLCALSLVFYYYHISNSMQKIIHVEQNGNFLVTVSSLQTFTEISRQYPEKDARLFSPSTLNSSVVQIPSNVRNSNTIRTEYQISTATKSGGPPGPAVPVDVGLDDLLDLVHTDESPHVLMTSHKPKPQHSSSRGSRRRSPYPGRVANSPRVLLLCGVYAYKASLNLKLFLEAHRIGFHHTSLLKGRSLVSQQHENRDRDNFKMIDLDQLALVIIVAGTTEYHSDTVRPYLDYCRAKHLPMIWVALPANSDPKSDPNPTPHPDSPTYVKSYTINSESVIHVNLSESYPFYYTRPGVHMPSVPPYMQWTTFSIAASRDSHVTPPNSNSSFATGSVAVGNKANQSNQSEETAPISQHYRTLLDIHVAMVVEGDLSSWSNRLLPAAVEDLGQLDGIRKIFVGLPLKFWLTPVILLDAMHVLCGVGLVRGGRERMVMVDIDDIFISPEGRKMTVEDVQVRRGTMYSVHVHCTLQLIFLRKSDCLGCIVLLCLVCLFDLACFFLSSFSSLIKMCTFYVPCTGSAGGAG